MISDVEVFYIRLLAACTSSFEKSVNVLCPLFNWVVFFLVNLLKCLVNSEY